MFQKLHKWLQKLLHHKLYKYQYVNDVPGKIKSGTIYIVQNNGYDWQIVMLCPCGCQKNLHMSLIKEYHPHWKYEIVKGEISLSPSVHRKVGCKSHFFITEGKIIWCKVSG